MVREALALLAPGRIAHGVGAADDADLVSELRDRGVHLEMAVRSNMQTGAVRELSRHPFPALLRRGVSVSLNTDNRTISGTTLSDEYALASDVLNLSWAELARATVLAARAIFAPIAVQRELVHRIQSAWASRAPEPGRPGC